MARKSAQAGKISTFFSYKGGVGRTMAVANVGFIAAMAGKRVLLMDWDLEAPGLAVYFRGITEHQAAGDIRKAPGVLDLFVNWRDALVDARSASVVSRTFRNYNSGKPFAACACPLLPAERLPPGAKLDIIGAGGVQIGTGEAVTYAEALSTFHWPSFFSDFAGGAMLEALRKWAKREYDLILVDSRTGLADVAGICTMQLPDEVVLCFVLNRQNTEGVADIAASIRSARGDDVAIRLSPMRVAKDRPTEEADARARAQREMRNAGLLPAEIEEDMAKLAVTAAPNIPFYETLAPFAATSPTADPLTFEYLRLTQELAGDDLELPKVDQAWIEAVRRRLQPRMTTSDYLAALETADPDRGIEEIDRFLDGALDADPSRELDAEYVSALVSAALASEDWYWEGDYEAQTRALARKAVLLLRQLHQVGDGDWRLQLVNALDECVIRGIGASTANADRDKILADGPQTAPILVRRVSLRIEEATRALRDARSRRKAERALDEAEQLLDGLPRPLQPDEFGALNLSYTEIAAMRAQIFAESGKRNQAVDQWERVLSLSKLGQFSPILVAQAHFGLAELTTDNEERADRVLLAVQTWRPITLRTIDRVEFATAAILKADKADRRAFDFLSAVVGKASEQGRSVRPMPPTYGTAARFVELLEQLITACGDIASRRRREILLDCVTVAEQQLHRFSRGPLRLARGVTNAGEAGPNHLRASYLSFCEALLNAGAPENAVEGLRDRLDRVRPRPISDAK